MNHPSPFNDFEAAMRGCEAARDRLYQHREDERGHEQTDSQLNAIQTLLELVEAA